MTTSLEGAFVGSQLASAEILDDQVNLYFRQSQLAIYNPVTIRSGDREARSGSSSFPSVLESVVGHTVSAIEAQPALHLILVLDSGARLVISLEPDDYSGPEAFSGRGPNGEFFVEQ